MIRNNFYFALGEINLDQANKVIELANELNSIDDYMIHIYLRSDGGFADARDIIVDILNRLDHTIYLAFAQSSAFEMVYLLNGNVKVFDWSWGMYHKGTIDVPYRDGLTESNMAKMKKQMSMYEHEKSYEMMSRLEFTDGEWHDIRNEKDVYFDADRLRQLFSYKLL